MSTPTPVAGPTWTVPSSSATPGEGRSSAPTATSSPGEGGPGGPTAASPVTTTSVAPPPGAEPGGVGYGLLIALLIATVVAALVAVVLLVRRQRRAGPAPAATSPVAIGTPVVTSSTVAAPATDLATVDRLVRDYDIAAAASERTAATVALGRLGVVVLAVHPGEPLDPRTHNVVGLSAESGPPGAVAEVVRPGWVRGREIVRAADVLAYPADDR